MRLYSHLLSTFLALVWLRMIYTVAGLGTTIKVGILMLPVLVCIWDGQWVVENVFGFRRRMFDYRGSPLGGIVSFFGWVMLVGIPFFMSWIARHTP